MSTLNRGIALFVILTLLLFAMACSDGSADGAYDTYQPSLDPVETFTEDDSPKTLTHDGRQFKSPWGYEKSGNATRSYPLLVSGCWGEGQGEYSAISKKHPAFVIDYQKNGTQDGAIAAGYRIDQTCVYLTGFSQGGSGSYPLASGMHAKGKYFAAIIRVAGQSQSDIGNAIADKTAIWYHIGLKDTDQRIQVARNALKNFRAYPAYANAIETTTEDTVTGMERPPSHSPAAVSLLLSTASTQT